ncbi:bifunctional DNA-formamidopyrimidine glycosylase/DNA-(apurinic or apyrimidinic site) lyase [Asaia krungthepensis]|uniref:Formamidopyrimidine-DNA glycosylase n=1 Tax=Asaia krungthepensis NRIC 0535 TaxID=1307925 RepID=A0ABQ0PXW3_9PROT|nr:bifunctional DNA-formamidopyrimidine glycosylase/DNA-(apurinic or apyrimidinic site) lyase [Asaia krungthepensis]GBQ84343.1 formamidopyrimidine-DNA glycosylase [Asaia krungthepensis NRIC 0535]
MPELPEVETILNGLRAALAGRRIIRTEIRNDLRWPVPDDLSIRADGKKIRGARRLGKYMLISLVRGPTLLIHLGMSGRIRITPGPEQDYEPLRHEHVTLRLDNGTHIGLVDPRRFGCFLLADSGRERDHALLRALGADPLEPEFDAAYLHARLHRKRSPIKTALLDQHVVAGLGNIYVSEILFRSGVHPERLASSLTPGEIGKLAEVTPAVLLEAINAGGSTLRDYVDADGNPGAFQDLHQVYGREGQPCPECPGYPACAGIRRLVQAGRSSFYCPRRQPPLSLEDA